MYYLRLSFILFLGMLFFSILVLLGINLIVKADLLPLWSIMLIIFVLSWIAQFIGHNHEGKKPSFLKDIQFLMIGPAWTLSHLFDAFKIKF
nr:Mpo1-like protein [Tenacibaculum sp. MAR_2010_89]